MRRKVWCMQSTVIVKQMINICLAGTSEFASDFRSTVSRCFRASPAGGSSPQYSAEVQRQTPIPINVGALVLAYRQDSSHQGLLKLSFALEANDCVPCCGQPCRCSSFFRYVTSQLLAAWKRYHKEVEVLCGLSPRKY